MTELKGKLEETVAIQSATLAGPLWNVDYQQVALILAVVASDPDVLGAVVYDEANNVVDRYGVMEASDQGVYRLSQDIEFSQRDEGGYVGRLELALTDQHLKQATWNRVLLGSGVVILILLSVIISVWIAYRRIVGLPLATLSDAIESTSTGQNYQVANWHSEDEMGKVVSAFNEMQHRQSDHESEIRAAREEEAQFLELASSISSELHLDVVLKKIIAVASKLLATERGSLFLYDSASDELWSLVSQGAITEEIRIPATSGLAGACFASGEILNIPDAYADPRFNRDVDRKTGQHTRNLLCMPVSSKEGIKLGVLQLINKIGGGFDDLDINRIKAFSAQFAIALENAQLFEDVENAKNYNESILSSLTNGVITIDASGHITKVNRAVRDILSWGDVDPIGKSLSQSFGHANRWVIDAANKTATSQKKDEIFDTEIELAGGSKVSVNMMCVPLIDIAKQSIGSMLVFEDISREKRVKSMMSRYVSGPVADQLLDSDDLTLGGAMQKVSILFSDIRQFTNLSERLGPRETVSMLNDYFTEMADIVFRHYGILDKYIGDAIMAVFGTPFVTDQDADNALAVASEMIVAVRTHNEKQSSGTKHSMDIGVGVATGEVVVGNIGSERRMDYTVIGDPVNLASRLEGANKYYGTKILLSESTINSIKTPATIREVDLIRVKGKNRAVSVFEALDHHNEGTFPSMNETLKAFERGLYAYRKRDWGKAISAFERALDANVWDRPSRVYRDRCVYYQSTPPADDWDGVWAMESK